MDERSPSDPQSFEEKTGSLKPKKDRPVKTEPRRQLDTPGLSEEKVDWIKTKIHEASHRGPETDIERINRVLSVGLALDQKTKEARDTIDALRLLDVKSYRECDSSSLKRVLSEIEKLVDGTPEWKKLFILGGSRVLWIVARKLVPGFSTVEDVLDGIEKKDFGKIAAGMVQIPAGDAFSWLLKELLPSK